MFTFKCLTSVSAGKKSRPEKKIRDAGMCIYDKLVYLIMPGVNVDLMNVVDSSHDVTMAGFDEGLSAAQARFSIHQ